MRLLELFNKNSDPLGSILGRDLEVTDHFKDRIQKYDYNSVIVMTNLKRLLKKHRQKIQAMAPNKTFILKMRDGSGISVLKQEVPDERDIIYKVKTINPTLKLGHEQYDYIFDSAILDEPTPTVGEIAEKNHCSLMAVEQQLKKGIKIEMEHTSKYKVAREIALDHLGEDLYYYDKLDKIEKTNEGQFRSQDVEEFKPSKEQLSDLKSKYLPDWEMLDHRILQAEYTAKDHRHADQFTKVINKISEEMDHFCEVTQDVAEVTVKTTTSDVKGLTLLDFQIAIRIDKVAEKMDIEQIRSKGNFDENFADGKGPGRPGDSARHGIPKGATIAQLEKAAKAEGRKGQLARWQLNMRRGKKKGK